MTENPNIDQLRTQVQNEFNSGNYRRVIELADEILKIAPKDFIALEKKFYSYYHIKNIVPEDEKEDISREYVAYAKNLVNILETIILFDDANKLRLYQVACNNIAWELYLHGNKGKDLLEGLIFVQKSIDKGDEEYNNDTKMRILLKLNKTQEAFEIAYQFMLKDPNAGDFQDIKNGEDYQKWVLQNHPLPGKYEGILASDKNFLRILEGIVGKEITRLTDLNSLKLGYFVENERISRLNLSYVYNLERIPDSIQNLTALKILNIYNLNRIENFTETIGNLESLEELNINNCYNLRSLPDSLFNLPNLKKLVINQCGVIQTIPETIKNFRYLEELSLKALYAMTSLPTSIFEIKSLRKLIINNMNSLEGIPETIEKLDSLEYLEFDYITRFRALPEKLTSLKNLKVLHLYNLSSIIELPNEIGKLENLEELRIRNCRKLNKLPESISNDKALKLIEIQDSPSIPSLPEDFKNLNNLECIILKKCQGINSLPNDFSNFTKLKELVITDNSIIKSVPENFWELKQIEKLDLENCPGLVVSPEKIKNLTSLNDLTLIKCQVTELPDILSSSLKINKINLKDNIYAPSKEEKLALIPRRWKKDYKPLRKLVTLGWDKKRNPSLVIFFGKQGFTGVQINITEEDIEDYYKKNQYSETDIKPEIKTGIHEVLLDTVTYSNYLLMRGRKGHLPSFKSYKIVEEKRYDHKTNQYITEKPMMYEKKDIKYRWGWRVNKETAIKDYHEIEESKRLSLPYLQSLKYEDMISKIKSLNINFGKFEILNNPNELLKLSEADASKYGNILNVILNLNIYQRKKNLSILLDSNPSKSILFNLLNIGSSELISGLFLELGKKRNSVLEEEAKNILITDIDWTKTKFANGIKRCAQIYVNSFDTEIKGKRIEEIKKNLSNMDLYLLPKEKVLSGSRYRKLAMTQQLKDSSRYYDYDLEKYVEGKKPKRYEPGYYTEGISLNYINFKNTIQEAEIYGAPEIIGKIAYYVDAPRLYYYLKGSGHGGALKYYQRYIRRIITDYARVDESKFIAAMKVFLPSYHPEDYLMKFEGNFYQNLLLRHFLYGDFTERAPSGWSNWSERRTWLESDQLSNLEGRYEAFKEVWDNHLADVIEIATSAKIKPIMRFCYYVLKESPNSQEAISKMEIRELVQLSLSEYKPLSECFSEILQLKLDGLEMFDPLLMKELMDCPSEELHDKAIDHFNKTNGNFAPKEIVELLFIHNMEKWAGLIIKSISGLNGNALIEFINRLIEKSYLFIEKEQEILNSILDALGAATLKINELDKAKKAEVFDFVSQFLFEESKIPDWMANLIEELIFAIDYKDLKLVANEMKLIIYNRAKTSRNNRIIAILKSLKFNKLPPDYDVVDILENGSSKMVSVLINIVDENKHQLNLRPNTCLLLYETEVTALNDIVATVFDMLESQQQKKLHQILLDSPVKRSYSFGIKKLEELYGRMIPKEFLIQLFEHSVAEVKAFIADKLKAVIKDFGNGNADLFMYYLKTILLLPNKHAKSKNRLYEVLPSFALQNKEKMKEIEDILLEIGGSNVITDSERALVSLALIKKEGE